MAEQGLTPTVLWAQRNDTILLTVSLTDIRNEKFSLEENVFSFKGNAGPEGNLYTLSMNFFKEVVPQESRHKKSDRGLYFVIKKKEEGPYWPRLLTDQKKPSYVKTDFNRWKDEDDSETEGDNPYQDDNLNALMQQMGGGGMGMGGMGMGGMGMGMGGMGDRPNLDDIADDDSGDSDDEPLPELES